MTATTTLLALSKDDLKALRLADQVSFHLSEHTGPMIRATRSNKAQEGDAPDFGPTSTRSAFPKYDAISNEIKREIVVSASIYDYAHYSGDETRKPKPNTAFEMVHSAQYSRTWRTIVAMLKEGDEVTVVFGADRWSSENVRKIGYHADVLSLVVTRQVRGKREVYEFLVDGRFCPDNTARMVRYVAPKASW